MDNAGVLELEVQVRLETLIVAQLGPEVGVRGDAESPVAKFLEALGQDVEVGRKGLLLMNLATPEGAALHPVLVRE